MRVRRIYADGKGGVCDFGRISLMVCMCGSAERKVKACLASV